MLRKPKTITASKTAPRSLKPQKARQLIRRFHSLQKWKSILLKRLNAHDSEIDESSYQTRLGSAYTEPYRGYKLPKTANTTPYPAVTDSSASAAEMAACVAQIDAEINLRGGLHVYQMASTVGQDHQRGGDSSKWLVKWFEAGKRRAHATLEIGCLSPNNSISTCGRFGEITRIDLNSQSPQILEQDFMARPLPEAESERFDMVSCSLVLNFVPSAAQRGEMLRRITQFLREPEAEEADGTGKEKGGRKDENSGEPGKDNSPGNHSLHKSALFLVLPLPCLANSRYFDRDALREIMTSLGFEQVESHEAKKVIYLLYDWNGKTAMKTMEQRKKREIHAGATRNNFYIEMGK